MRRLQCQLVLLHFHYVKAPPGLPALPSAIRGKAGTDGQVDIAANAEKLLFNEGICNTKIFKRVVGF